MKKFIILIPVYNDWKSVFKLLKAIDLQITEWNAEVSVLIINDASTEERPAIASSFKNIKSVRVMNMKKNQGHARCYATGLKFLSIKEDFDYLIPMDGVQTDHLKAYGIIHMVIKKGITVEWFLNYRGGSFLVDVHQQECLDHHPLRWLSRPYGGLHRCECRILPTFRRWRCL